MPPRKVIDPSRYHDKDVEPKLVIPEVRIPTPCPLRYGTGRCPSQWKGSI